MNFFEQAFAGKNNWWRYLIVILVSFVGGQLLGSIPLWLVISIKTLMTDTMSNPTSFTDFEAYGINSTLGLALLLFPFVLSFILMILLFKPMHNRAFKTAVSGNTSIRWNRLLFGFVLWAIIAGVGLIIDYSINGDKFELQFDLAAWLPLIFVSLLIIPLQAGYEELLFRGYLAQGVGLITKNRLAAIILPSVLFALMHAANPEIEKYGFWVMMPQYFTMGLIFALISVWDDGIELAIGAHAANNAFISIFVVTDGAVFQTDALLKMNEVDPMKEYYSLIIGGIVFIGILFWKYNWKASDILKKVKKVANH
jgi:membrane protease YdiL (CAAX protease family)